MRESGFNALLQPATIKRLLLGLGVSLKIALVSMLLSIIFGIVLGVLMTKKNKIIQVLSKIYLEIVRIMPQLVLIYIVYFGLAKAWGISLEGETSAIIAFTFWGTAEMGDLVRGAIEAIPKHQFQSAKALGMNKWQMNRYIIIPQTIRRLLPNVINLLTRMIKTTSIVIFIGVVELTAVGKQIIDAFRFEYSDTAIWIYGAIFLIYFLICWPFSILAKKLENKMKEGQ